jgi:hypothetical protein
MIVFSGNSIIITINYDSLQLMTLYDSLHSLLDYECRLFHCDDWRKKNFSWMNCAERPHVFSPL